MSPRSRRIAGVTLLEVMVVVAIVGILAAVMGPDLNRARADAQAANATAALVRLGVRARSQAVNTRLAHALAWLPDMGDGFEGVILARGTSDRCNSVVWNWNTALAADVGNGQDFSVRMGQQKYSRGNLVLLLRSITFDNARICIQPNGRTLIRSGDGGLFMDDFGGITDVAFTFEHQLAGAPVGVLRTVVFPNGNVPRLVL